MTTNPERLSDEDLANFIRWGEVYATDGARDTELMIARELRELRALLATPMPCGWPAPRAQPNCYATASNVVVAEWIEEAPDVPELIDPDEAIALGAALVRAGLAARGGR